MDFGSFLAGAAEAGSQDLDRRRDQALKLKLESRLIEMNMAKEEAIFQRGRVKDSTAKSLYESLGIPAPANSPVSEEAALGHMAGLTKAKTAADGRNGKNGQRDYILGSRANQALKAKVFKDDEYVSPLQYRAIRDRINKESPPAALDTAFTELSAGIKNIDRLIELRKNADASGFTGPVGGPGGTALGALTGGRNILGVSAGPALDLDAQIGLIAPGVAKSAGHVGNLNIEEVKSAVTGIGNRSLHSSVAVPRLTRLKEMMEAKRIEIAEKYPALKRKGAITGAGQDLDPFVDEDEDDALIDKYLGGN
jgi:hypothetical protein